MLTHRPTPNRFPGAHAPAYAQPATRQIRIDSSNPAAFRDSHAFNRAANVPPFRTPVLHERPAADSFPLLPARLGPPTANLHPPRHLSGICGIVHWNDEPATEEKIRPMLDAAPHRGPDGVFSRAGGAAAFGYLSLEITPESRGEVQPLVHTPTGVMAVADLRLDNRDDLIQRIGKETVERHRTEISARGRTPGNGAPTDAELVLIAYLRWEADCFARLLGDFALAIWDPRARRVLLARDPMAMRALYYRVEPHRTLFATEVKQILAVPGVERTINHSAVAAHVTNTHYSLATSFYDGIDQVPAGRTLSVSALGSDIRPFWKFDPETRIRYRKEQDYADHFRDLFCDAVACRMRTEKPVGISLSGGMDSGSIAATVGWLKEKGRIPADPDFRAYSWAFSELEQCDERENSGRITHRYKISTIRIPADDAWTLANYPEHGPDADEPYVGVYQRLIDRTVGAARNDGTRLLFSGDRGDLLVGCAITDMPDLLIHGNLIALYKELRFRASPAKVPSSAFKHAVKPILIDAARSVFATLPTGVVERLKPSRKNRTPKRTSIHNHLNEGFLGEYDTLTDIYEPVEPLRRRSSQKRHRYIFTPMHMKGMVWSERTNARLGVGFADPFSDRRLTEFVLAIPQRFVNRLCDQKRLLRTAMRNIIPADAIRGALKVSPEPLCEKGLKHEARNLVIDLITNSEVARHGYVKETALHNEVRAYLNGANNLDVVWSVLSLEMWLRRYWR